MANKQKAWRLGAAILRRCERILVDGTTAPHPAARKVKDVATLMGTAIRTKQASSGWLSQQPSKYVPSGYVAPRRFTLRPENAVEFNKDWS
jgi:hypothetical protein